MTSTLKLRGGFSENPRLVPLLQDRVRPRGIEIEWDIEAPNSMFHRHLKEDSFDVFEFSISNYLISREKRHGDHWDWIGIPIFLSRAFLSFNAFTNVSSGVNGFADLKDKRFGLPDFPMTAGLWMRIMIRELYGIGVQDVTWYNGREPAVSHSVQMGVDRDPPKAPLVWMQQPGQLSRMLHDGEIDAAFGDAGVAKIQPGPNVRPLFDDGGRSVVEAFYHRTGFTPVNHTLMVQRRVVEKDPWVAESLYEAFEESKQQSYRDAQESQSAYMLFPGTDFARQQEAFGPDPYPSGLRMNRQMLIMAAQESFDEGLTHKLVDIDDLFAEPVRQT